jgi:beta-glucanase (GH16 family)
MRFKAQALLAVCATLIAGCIAQPTPAPTPSVTPVTTPSVTPAATVTAAPTETPIATPPGDWQLVWHDEFDSPNGQPPDPTNWGLDVGGSLGNNNELQVYTNRPENAYHENGKLVIKAGYESYDGYRYTSARLTTKGRFEQAYGRFEARIKVPYGRGIWPAFWMLGNDIDHTQWPNSGEIDIMEHLGSEPSKVHASAHGPGYSASSSLTSEYDLPQGRAFSAQYHVFAVEWETGALRFFVDNKLYYTVTPQNLPPGQKWVFDHPFYMLLNVAVGGNWPGNPDETTKFPQFMYVDYVRVYSH